jgi:hypothetical protein
MAFTLTSQARLFLVSLTTRQTSLHAADRSVAPPKGAFDDGLRPEPFPAPTAILLPGTLAFTRTGLPPAGTDGLALVADQTINTSNSGHT